MTQCSVQPRAKKFVKCYGFLSFDKNMGKTIGQNISENLSGKYSWELLDRVKQSTTADDLIGNKTAVRITKFSKYLPQNNSETVTNEHDKEIPKERCKSSEERQTIIDDLTLI